MIIGKGSIWKFAVLFVLVLLAVLDIIFAAQSKENLEETSTICLILLQT